MTKPYQIIENPDVEKLLNDSPKTLYKYLDWNNPYNKKVIELNELFFSSPKNFNDPFDCKIEKRYDLMTPEECESYFYELAKHQSEIYNLNWNEKKLQSEIKRLKLENNFKDLEKLKKDNDYFFSQYDNFYAVFCTSRRWDNIPMWAYYANNHKGICVGFDLKAIYHSGKVGTGGNVTYDTYPTIKPNQNFHERTHKQTYHKANDWAHEEEYRFMTFNMPKHGENIMTDEAGNLKGIKIIADDSWYKEILLGVNMSRNDINEVIKLSENKIKAGTRVYQMVKGRFEFKIEKIEVDFRNF